MLSFSFNLIQYINGINVATCLGQVIISTETKFKANAGDYTQELAMFQDVNIYFRHDGPAHLLIGFGTFYERGQNNHEMFAVDVFVIVIIVICWPISWPQF